MVFLVLKISSPMTSFQITQINSTFIKQSNAAGFLVLFYKNFICLFPKTFFGPHLFLDRKRVPPQNPAPDVTILSNAPCNTIKLDLNAAPVKEAGDAAVIFIGND